MVEKKKRKVEKTKIALFSLISKFQMHITCRVMTIKWQKTMKQQSKYTQKLSQFVFPVQNHVIQTKSIFFWCFDC